MFSLNTLFKNRNAKQTEALLPIVKKINDLEKDFEVLDADKLKAKTLEFRARLTGAGDKKPESLDDILPEAFAAVREAAKRTLGQRHFDVQLIGGMMLHKGKIAEMKTGEGKTLVATLPAYLNALEGKGVHVITVNDYLSRRDGVWMGQIYDALGLSVGVITHDTSYLYDPKHKEEDKERDQIASFKIMYDFLRPSTRPEAYAADITYGTNSEYGFDYLRDNIEYQVKNIRQRNFHYALVDEIDSILIDEARTPLIISAPSGDSEDLYAKFASLVNKLNIDEDYTVDEKFKQIQLTDDGITKAEKLLGIDNIYTDKGIKYVHHLETAVRAKALYHLDKEYVVREGEVIIVDEFTGRLQPGRRWSDGLHQAIEAKEGARIQKESRTYASITYQNFFRMYKKLGGMTGTAVTSSEEFFKVYNLDVVEIPTNMPIARADKIDLIFQTESGKFRAIAKKIKEINEKGQPVLVGTVSIEKNEVLSQYLKREGVIHEILNAKNHEREGEIVANAGKKGSVTIATNMAGRGVDIKLGGAMATKELHDEVKAAGGLFVLGTERHEARRIDNQLRGRSGRQGDPGETQFFVSLEDTLMRVFAPTYIKTMMNKFGIPEDQPIETRLISRALESAQTKIEGFNFDARKHVLEYDDVMSYQRKIVYGRRRAALLAQGEELALLIDEIFKDADEEFKKNLEEKKKTLSVEQFYKSARTLYLQTIDMFWMEHLEGMEYMRSSVSLRSYGQRDPLVEYKKEGLTMYKQMEQSVVEEMFRQVPHMGGAVITVEMKNLEEIKEGAESLGAADGSSKAITENQDHKVGRNEKIIVMKNGEEKEIKSKKLEQYLKEGWAEKK
ncbi:TPA: preprotein translocase subunit SecA [Candidatus Taylorbacteria bacterium]|nr:preprotein translocase subunit SecA [Candidatus Taylorbacteria bacterium]